MIRDWVIFSSSSGETLKELWARLSEHERAHCQGFFSDRDCGSLEVAKTLVNPPKIFASSKEKVEKDFLEFSKSLSPDTLVLLLGFFGILSDDFLQKCPFAIVNTHPSLLPAFAGLDKRVHKEAFKGVCVTGFTIHMVSEIVDGGTILFQHPVWVDSAGDWENSRAAVRKCEQALLPQIWKKLLASDLKKSDLNLSCPELRSRLGLNQSYFEKSKGII